MALAEIIAGIKAKPDSERTEAEKATLRAFEEHLQRGQERLKAGKEK